MGWTHIFDVGARVDGDHVAVLDTEVVSDDTVDASAAVIEIIIRQDNQNRVLALLALDKDGITAEELEGLHRVVGKGNNGVVIVDGIGNTIDTHTRQYPSPRSTEQMTQANSHQRVGLLLLLEDSGRGVELLATKNKSISPTRSLRSLKAKSLPLSSRRPRGHYDVLACGARLEILMDGDLLEVDPLLVVGVVWLCAHLDGV